MSSGDDENAIAALLVRYATAADTRDEALMTSCFTEAAMASYGQPIGDFADRAALVSQLMAMLGGLGPTLHYITNVTVQLNGDSATSRCYTHAVVVLPNQGGPIRTAGTYDDVLRRGADGWRIERRVYTGIA